MSERLSHSPENDIHPHSPEYHNHTPETHKHTPEANNEHHENIDNIRQHAERQATSSHELVLEEEKAATHRPSDVFVNKELKNLAYARTLSRVRKQLNPLSRNFSKLVHQPVVEAVSETTAKTVGRPSGILGGGIIALAGTTAYYYITKHYGYEYNFGIFLLLMAAGFAIGWILEFLFRAMHSRR